MRGEPPPFRSTPVESPAFTPFDHHPNPPPNIVGGCFVWLQGVFGVDQR